MKQIVKIAILVFGFSIASCNAPTTKETESAPTTVVAGMSNTTFKVWGNCEMCKETIESSLKVEGIAKADWNVDSKMISVQYDSTKITLDQIKKNIASVGYDNDVYKGDDKAYGELADCCQYDRK